MNVTPAPGAPIGRRAALRRGAAAIAALLATPALGALDACAPAGPPVIAWGRVECAFCRMVVSDPRFGAALVSATGRTEVFDSIECLAASVLRERERRGTTPRALWVSDSEHPGTLIRAESARFTRLDGSASPMGKGLAALAPDAKTGMAWLDVLALVERDGLRRGAGAEPGGADATRR